MQDAELWIGLAGIAGVFVGFGALISTRHDAPGELWLMRNVVNQGLLVIAAALLPVAIDGYGLTGHQFWLICSLLILVLDWTVILLLHTRRENMAFLILRTGSARATLTGMLILLELPAQVLLLLAVLGLLPDVEPSLYRTAVVLMLFEAAVLLVMLVYSQRSPAAPGQ